MKFIQSRITLILALLCFANGFAANSKSKTANDVRSNVVAVANATIATAATVTKTAVCKDDESPVVTFSVLSGGTAPYTFFYTENGTFHQQKTTQGSNTASFKVNTDVVGIVTITLDSVSSTGLPAEVQIDKTVAITISDLPTIDFTFNNNVCAGVDVNFNSIVNIPSDYTYYWEFGDNSTSTEQNPVHYFYTVGSSGSEDFEVKLTVTNKKTNCSSTVTKSVTIIKGGDTSILSSVGVADYNGYKTFSVCENVTKTITFQNNSSTKATDTNYVIDWGDGSPAFSGSTWTALDHTYNPGLWNLKYTVFTGAGCEVTRIYKVFIGSNPSVSLGNPGNTDVCSGTTLKFPIYGVTNNPPGTTYTISFNDGTAPVVYNHPPPAEIEHVFNKTSCGTTSSNGTTYFDNSFSATIVAQNPCGKSSVNVVPIYVSTLPKATIKATKLTGCVNEKMYVYYPNSESTMAGPNGCVGVKVVWSITPNTNYTLNGSVLGDDNGSDNYNLWKSGSYAITPTFTQPGQYIIRVRTGNKCATDEAVDTICIGEAPMPTFTLDKAVGCFPLKVNTNNTTSEINNCGKMMEYQWQIVSYAQGGCGTSSSYTMTDGSNIVNNSYSTAKNTQIVFNAPGIYTLRLAATNNCGTSYSAVLQTITVNAPPKAEVAEIKDLCQTFPETIIKPTVQVTNCGADSLNYEWSFVGGVPSSSNNKLPGDIKYATFGKYIVSLKVSNECGFSTISTRSFTIKPQPVITNMLEDQDKCAGQKSDLIHFDGNVENIIFRWTNNNTQIGLSANGTGDILPFTLQNTGSTTITAVITVTPTLNDCDGVPQQVKISVKPSTYISSQPTSSSVCLNGTPETLSVSYKNGTGVPLFQWYSNTENNTTTGTSIPSATSSTYIPPTNALGTIYYYCILTLSDGCGSIISDIASVTVTEFPTIKNNPLPSQTICVGGIINPVTVATQDGTGTPTYQWYTNTVNSNTGGTPINGANAARYTPPAFNAVGSYYYYVIVSYPLGGACGNVLSNTAEVVVVADPIIITQPLVSQSVCEDAIADSLLVTASGGVGNFLYQWYVNNVNSSTNGQIIAGATSAYYIPPTGTVGTLYYYCVVSQSAVGCSVISTVCEVKVTQAPTITNQPQSATICLGSAMPVLSVAYKNGVGTPQYQWYKNVVDDTPTAISITEATGATYTPPVSSVGTIYYFCVITFSFGGCNTLVSKTVSVTVNQYPVVSDFTRRIGNGKSFTVLPADNPPTDIVPTGTTYTWTEPMILPAGAISGASAQLIPQTIISQQLTNNTMTAATVVYTVTPVANGCVGNSFKITVIIDPAIKTDVIQGNITCFGTNDGYLDLTISGGVPPYSILWTGPGGFSSTTSNISGLIPGEYF
ncbi:MAG: PKD domain-containing protein [Paludibacteraceae bacterium]